MLFFTSYIQAALISVFAVTAPDLPSPEPEEAPEVDDPAQARRLRVARRPRRFRRPRRHAAEGGRVTPAAPLRRAGGGVWERRPFRTARPVLHRHEGDDEERIVGMPVAVSRSAELRRWLGGSTEESRRSRRRCRSACRSWSRGCGSSRGLLRPQALAQPVELPRTAQAHRRVHGDTGDDESRASGQEDALGIGLSTEIDLNPIELAWSKIKAALRGLGARTVPLLKAAIRAASGLVTPADAAGWYKHCLVSRPQGA
jgi:hypothetical protein